MTANFLGSWTLQHCKMLDINGAPQPDPFHGASGVIMYDANGMMAAQIMQHNHERSIIGDIFAAPTINVRTAFEGYIAYYGSYRIDEANKAVTHSVLGALWPNMVGMNVIRRFEFKNNNTLILSTLDYETIGSEQPIMRFNRNEFKKCSI